MRARKLLPVSDPVLLTFEQARAHLHIGETAMRRLIHDGRIPVVVLSAQTLITRRALEAFAASLEKRQSSVA